MENPQSDDYNLENKNENEEENLKEKHVHKKTAKVKKSTFSIWWKWPLTVLALSLMLSFVFSVGSEFLLKGTNVIFAVLVIVLFLILSIMGDMIGVAVTASSIEPFRAMASRKVRGANEAINLVKNADKVASVFADILGDICGILSGAAGACISLALIQNSMSNFEGVLIASAVSSVIAALTIFGKSAVKKYSIKHCEKIILICGKILSVFHSKNNKKTKK